MSIIVIAEVARVYVAVVAGLLGFLFLRLAWQRARHYGFGFGVNPHPLASAGIAGLTILAAARQYAEVGDGLPPTWRLWAVAAVMTLTVVGMAMAVDWDFPWREETSRSKRDASMRDHPSNGVRRDERPERRPRPATRDDDESGVL